MTSLTRGLQSLRSLQPRTRTKEVSFLTVAFKIGTAVLMAVAVGIFVVAQVEISAAGAELSMLSKATTQHHYAARSAQWARELSLNGINSVNEQAMRADMDVLKAALHTTRFVGARREYVEELWHTPSINVDMYAGNGTWYTMPTNLYDLGSQLVAHMYALGQGGLGRNYSENTHWRFVMDNAVTQAVPEFKGLQSALSQSILDYRDLYLDLQIVMVAVLFLSLFALGQCVYRRAVHRVSVIKRGILDVVQAMEQAQLKLLLKEAKSSRRFVLRASASVASGHDVEQGGGLNPSRSRSAKDKAARPARQATSAPVSSPVRGSRRNQAGRVSPASPSLPTISEPTVAAARNQQQGVPNSPSLALAKAARGPSRASPTEFVPRHGRVLRLGEESFMAMYDSDSDSHGYHSDSSGVNTGLTRPLPSVSLGGPTQFLGDTRRGRTGRTNVPDGSPNSIVAVAGGVTPDGAASRASNSSESLYGRVPVRGRGAASGAACTPSDICAGILQHSAPDVAVGADAAVGVAGQNMPHMVTREADGALVEVPHLSDILHATPGAVVVADVHGTIQFVSDHFTRMLGYTRRRAIGSSLALFVPREQLSGMQKTLRKLIVTGQVDHGQGATDEGIQTEVVAMSGDLVPMLVNMARMEVAGRYWVVLDMQDLRNHHKSQDTVLEVAEDTDSKGCSYSLTHQVIASLVFLGLLQCVNVIVGYENLVEMGRRTHDIRAAGLLQTDLELVAFQARETVIGDGQVWGPETAASILRSTSAGLDQAVLNVFLGTARSWSIPDSLFIGETVGGEMEPGITGNMHRTGRAVHDIVRDYSTTAAGTGPHVQQLRAVAPLQHLLSANSGKLANDLALLAQFFQGDADSMASAAQLANAVISCVHILFVTLMYVVVFRRVVNSLLQEVARTESLLMVIPEAMAVEPNLSKFFVRRVPQA